MTITVLQNYYRLRGVPVVFSGIQLIENVVLDPKAIADRKNLVLSENSVVAREVVYLVAVNDEVVAQQVSITKR